MRRNVRAAPHGGGEGRRLPGGASWFHSAICLHQEAPHRPFQCGRHLGGYQGQYACGNRIATGFASITPRQCRVNSAKIGKRSIRWYIVRYSRCQKSSPVRVRPLIDGRFSLCSNRSRCATICAAVTWLETVFGLVSRDPDRHRLPGAHKSRPHEVGVGACGRRGHALLAWEVPFPAKPQT